MESKEVDEWSKEINNINFIHTVCMKYQVCWVSSSTVLPFSYEGNIKFKQHFFNFFIILRFRQDNVVTAIKDEGGKI